jgi:phosphoadenosine phosphosulfate reductase
LRKLEPLQRALQPFALWVTGQRRGQSPTRADVHVLEADRSALGVAVGRLELNPLALWSSARVWQYIRERGVLRAHAHRASAGVCMARNRWTHSPGRVDHYMGRLVVGEEGTQRECGLHVRA